MATETGLAEAFTSKWEWLVKGGQDALELHVDNQCIFVHMSSTLTKSQELEVVKSGMVKYKKADQGMLRWFDRGTQDETSPSSSTFSLVVVVPEVGMITLVDRSR